jgi:heptosyltransferase-3
MELQNIGRLAVFKMRNIGDVLMITPALRALRESFPGAHITVVVNAGTEAMLANNPDVDEVLVFNRDEAKGSVGASLLYELGFVRQLRRRHFDLTIGFTDGDRAAWYSLFCGARYRVGSAHRSWGRFDPRRLIYNYPAPSSAPKMHEVERHFWILEKAGVKLRSPRPGALRLVVPDDLKEWAAMELLPLRPARIIHVHAVSRWLWKCWGNESMAEIIDWLETERDVRVVMTTGPVERERDRAREILDLCRTRPRFYDGTLSLGQIAALSAQANGYFGVDTAPMHMAAAVGIPVIALFGPTGPRAWRPWSAKSQVLSSPCLCNRLEEQVCDWSKVRACLAAITVDEAKAALDLLLSDATIPAAGRP